MYLNPLEHQALFLTHLILYQQTSLADLTVVHDMLDPPGCCSKRSIPGRPQRVRAHQHSPLQASNKYPPLQTQGRVEARKEREVGIREGERGGERGGDQGRRGRWGSGKGRNSVNIGMEALTTLCSECGNHGIENPITICNLRNPVCSS